MKVFTSTNYREDGVGVDPDPTTTHHRETRLDREADPEREHGHNRSPGPEHHRGGRS